MLLRLHSFVVCAWVILEALAEACRVVVGLEVWSWSDAAHVPVTKNGIGPALATTEKDNYKGVLGHARIIWCTACS